MKKDGTIRGYFRDLVNWLDTLQACGISEEEIAKTLEWWATKRSKRG